MIGCCISHPKTDPELVQQDLHRRIRILNINALECQNTASEHKLQAMKYAVNEDRVGARAELRQAKLAQRDYERVINSKSQLQEIVRTITTALDNAEHAKHLQHGADVLSSMDNTDMDILMDNVRDQLDRIQTQTTVLAEPLTMETSDLDDELNRLMSVDFLPSVPVSAPITRKQAEKLL